MGKHGKKRGQPQCEYREEDVPPPGHSVYAKTIVFEASDFCTN